MSENTDIARVMYQVSRRVSAPTGSYTKAVLTYWERVYKADVQRRLVDCLEGRDKVRL